MFWFVELNPPGPVQLYVTPFVEELPTRVTLLTVQVRLPEIDAFTPVAVVVSCRTGMLLVDVHPLEGFFTTNV
jgi:hypothetical protein